MSEVPAAQGSQELKQALERYVADGCPSQGGNAYLDALEIAHPQFTHERSERKGAEVGQREYMVSCGPGSHPAVTWVPDRHGGHNFYYCEAD
jgi:hypothetical protein